MTHRVTIKKKDTEISTKPMDYGDALSLCKQMRCHFGCKAFIEIEEKTSKGWVLDGRYR